MDFFTLTNVFSRVGIRSLQIPSALHVVPIPLYTNVIFHQLDTRKSGCSVTVYSKTCVKRPLEKSTKILFSILNIA